MPAACPASSCVDRWIRSAAPPISPDSSLLGAGEVVADDPLAGARALLEQDRQARLQVCAAELQQVLDRHGMRLEVTPAQVTLMPRE